MLRDIQTKFQELFGLGSSESASQSDATSASTGHSDTPQIGAKQQEEAATLLEEDKGMEEPTGLFYARMSINESPSAQLIQKIPTSMETPATRLPNFEERILRLRDPTSPRPHRPANLEELKLAQGRELVEAATRNDLNRCRELLIRDSQAGSIAVNPNLLNAQGQAALHVAALNGFFGVCEILVNFGEQTDLNVRDGQGKTPLHYACLHGQVQIAEFLLKCGADVNLADAMGSSALHYAAEQQNEVLVNVILARSPNLNMQNVKGETPSDLARGRLVALLKDPGLKKHVPPSTSVNPTPFSRIIIRDSSEDEVNIMMGIESRLDGTPKTQDVSPQKRVAPEDFELLQQLGKGSFGEVFLVQYRPDQKLYAMKVLRKEKIMGQNLVKYAMTERNVLSYIRHPFIVTLNYAFQTADKLFLILDYCPGGDMGWHLSKDKRFNEHRARLYASEILLALEELHRRDIIFRDLKPDNVVFDEDGHAMLTDFGLSREGVFSSDSAKSFCGSIAYLAPEMLKRQGHGKAVDWYLLGVLLYEMLVGTPPYFTHNREQLFQNIQHGQLRLPGHLSLNAKNIIKARDPAHRLGSGARGAEEIKQHPFFSGVNWEAVLLRQMKPPTLPKPLLTSPARIVKENVYGKPVADPNTYLAGWSFVSK